MSIYLNTNQKTSCFYEENTVLSWILKMKNWQSPIALFAITLAALFGASCKSSELPKSDGAVTDAKNIRTTVTRENLKARLTVNKVKFIEKEEDLAPTGSGEVPVRREMVPLTLKIVGVENEPNVEFMGSVYKLHEFSIIAKNSIREIERLTLPATEADIAFYNSKGIAVEDFEAVIRSLDEPVKEFAVDFLGHESSTEATRVARTNNDFKAPTSELPKDDGPLLAEPPPPAPTPSPLSERAPITAGVMNGRAISRVEPTYPPAARAVGASGPVNVQILVDEDGNVVTASAISGHPLLQAAAVAAVRQWRFTPTRLSGQLVKTRGTVTVNFRP